MTTDEWMLRRQLEDEKRARERAEERAEGHARSADAWRAKAEDLERDLAEVQGNAEASDAKLLLQIEQDITAKQAIQKELNAADGLLATLGARVESLLRDKADAVEVIHELAVERDRAQSERDYESKRASDLSLRVKVLQDAIREHRDARGDDRCWQDDRTLYEALGESYDARECALPEPDVMLANCKRYVASRQPDGVPYQSPQRKIEAADMVVLYLRREIIPKPLPPHVRTHMVEIGYLPQDIDRKLRDVVEVYEQA